MQKKSKAAAARIKEIEQEIKKHGAEVLKLRRELRMLREVFEEEEYPII